MVSNLSFFNGCFDKGRLKSLISWSLINCGEQFTIELVENLKDVGFEYATQAGVSLSLDDLKIPPSKVTLVSEAELQVISAQIEYKRGHLTAVEKFQQLIDTWHRTSETLKQNVIEHFRATDILNPVYMMAFSGARGNVSQVRQLVGMRGLMADPQGQIIDFPIRSNFREGLTLTEYVISCYGARKGLVDTALRTANSGYLTRRLVDVSQHVIVREFDCRTPRGIFLSDMTEGPKVLLSLQNRLLGRVLAEDIYTDLKPTNEIRLTNRPITFLKPSSNAKQNLNFSLTVALNPKEVPVTAKANNKNIITPNLALSKSSGVPGKQAKLANLTTNTVSSLVNPEGVNPWEFLNLPQSNLVASKNQEISLTLAEKIAKLRIKVLVRSPLTCQARRSICQLCYGWSLAHGNLVSLGEAVGILAAQSIGEPGTQLTMRTFHTGGVFSGDLMTEIRAPFNGVINFTEALQGVLIRTPHGKIAFLTKTRGYFYITPCPLVLSIGKDPNQQGIQPKVVNLTTNKVSSLGNGQGEEKLENHLVKKEVSSLRYKFQIPASTILFVRQKEFVLEKQLIAEFSSISTQTNQRIRAKHNLNSELEGQVFFDDVFLSLKRGKNDDDDVTRIAQKLGSIWILSGKIYQTMVPTSFFPKSGDLIDSNSVINQILVISPYTGFLGKINKKKLLNLPLGFTSQVKLRATLSSGEVKEPIYNILENPPLAIQSEKPEGKQPKVVDKVSDNLLHDLNEKPNIQFRGVIEDRNYDSPSGFTASRKSLFIKNPILNSNSIRRLKSFTELKKRYDNSRSAPLSLSSTKMKTSGLLQNPGNLLPRKNLSLSSTLLSFNVKKVSYSQVGYFITFWNNRELSLDLTKTSNKKVENINLLPYSVSKKQSLHSLTLGVTSSVKRGLDFYPALTVTGTPSGFRATGIQPKVVNLTTNKVSSLVNPFGGDHLDLKQNWDFKQNWLKNKICLSKTDLFFLSTSLKQELSNSENLKELLYLQSFPKNYKTQTGGILFNDSLYLDNNGGQIFWIPEETYKLNLKTFVIPTHTGFTLFPLFGFSQVNLKKFLQKSPKKWINNNFPLLSKYNLQGKIINFSSKMSGWLQLKPSKNLSTYTKINSKPLKLKSSSVKTTKSLVSNFFKKETFPERGGLANSFSKPAFWEIHRLKTLLSNQSSNPKNIATLPIKTIYFRRNPYILVKQKYLKSYKILPYKENYPNNFSKFGKISSVPKLPEVAREKTWFVPVARHPEGVNPFGVPVTERASTNLGNQTDLHKLAWFVGFKEYKFNKDFLNEEYHTGLKPKVPFINSQFSFTSKNSILTTFLKLDEVSQLGFISTKKQFGDSNNIVNQKPSLKAQLPKIKSFSTNNDSFEIGIKSGWVYFPRNKVDFQSYHKQIIKPGSSFTDNIEFDQHITYIECISIPLFLSNNYKCYFSTFQVKEKNLSLKLKLNLQELIEEFPVPLLRRNSHISFLLDNKTHLLCQNLNGKHLNFFLFKLQKSLSLHKLILEERPFPLHVLTLGEIDLVTQGIPNYIKLGSHITLAYDKIYYIKNRNQRYSSSTQNKNITYSAFKIEEDSLLKKSNSFYLAKSYLKGLQPKVVNLTTNKVSSLGKNLKILNNRSITQIAFFNINSFVFQSILPKQLVTKSFSKASKVSDLPKLHIDRDSTWEINPIGAKNKFKTNEICSVKLETSFFTPSFCILIRKVTQYSIFKSKYYKKLLSENNQRGIISNPLNSIGILTNLTWFNKQIETQLFSSFPSADLQINSSLRFKNSRQTFVTKQLNIFEFFILLNIPKRFPFKIAKVDLNLKQLLSPLNLTKAGSLEMSELGMQAKLANLATFSSLVNPFGENLVDYYSPVALPVTTRAKRPKIFTNNIQVLTLKQKFSTNYKNNFFKYLELFYQTNCLEFIVFRNIDNSSFMVPALKNKTPKASSRSRTFVTNFVGNLGMQAKLANPSGFTTQFTNTRVLLHSQNYIFTNNPLSLTDFFSPYRGEIIEIRSDSLGKQSCFFLTEKDQLCFSTDTKIPSTFVGKLIRYGEQIAENLAIPDSGQIIQVDKSKVILRKAQPILFSSKGIFYVHHGDFVEKNSPLLTLFYQRLKTGDIVQGIPRIEQLFEARQAKEGELLSENLNYKLHAFFKKYTKIYIPRDATRISLEKTQQLLIDGVQKVYHSQGVTIADKHLEIIVRQMTSKVKIIEGGRSGLLRGELIDLSWIEMVNNGIDSQKAEYEPVILGITKAALETESFISAASFQETTRILARAAIERKTDFLRGLKENVILGHLIPAGTGFSRLYNPVKSTYIGNSKKSEIWNKILPLLKKKKIPN